MSAIWLLAPATRAQPTLDGSSSTLLFVRAAGDDDLARRIEAELAAGWRFVHVGPDAGFASGRLAGLARAHGAVAAVRLDAGRGELELWVLGSEATGEGSTDLLATEGSDERVLALRAIEILRARMLARERTQKTAGALGEAPQPAPEPKPDTTEPAATRAGEPAGAGASGSESVLPAHGPQEPALPSSYPGLWLELAPAVAYSRGGLSPALDGWLGMRLQPAPLWSVAGFALLPIWSERLQGAEGSARVATLIFGSGVFFQLVRSHFELGLGGGPAGVIAFTSGEPRGPYRGARDTAFAPALFASASLHLRLGAGLSAYLRPLAGVTLPQLAVRFGASSAARWGAPFLACSLGLELTLLGG